MIWFTSDLHFGHRGIIKHCKRPWDSIEEMDDGLIAVWNWTVDVKDTVYILGDFSFHRDDRVSIELARSLKGNKHLLKGNHDHRKTCKKYAKAGIFQSIESYVELKIRHPSADPLCAPVREMWVLSHYPLLSWNKHQYGSFHLHGHCHGSLNAPYSSRRLDVGVDCHGYRPLSMDEIRGKLVEREVHEIDHHRRRKDPYS